jgi:hypothetical protein
LPKYLFAPSPPNPSFSSPGWSIHILYYLL